MNRLKKDRKTCPPINLSLRLFLALIAPFILWVTIIPLNAQPLSEEKNIKIEWGGYIRTQESVSWPDDKSYFQPVGTGPNYDNRSEFRLNNKLFFSKNTYLKTHYEVTYSGGDTRSKANQLKRERPDLFANGLILPGSINDDRRLMDLTHNIHESNNSVITHRLDRLSLTLQPEWGTVRVGRQALTWGNGLLFNPMDLFNPFAPTDILRYYKVGDDMVTTQFPIRGWGDFQFLYVPRRGPADGNVKFDQSSLAGKVHFSSGTTEFDIMSGVHYDNGVIGFGSTGYLGDAAWRFDATYTSLSKDRGRDGYVAMVANVDYSWTWWEKNCYGFLEFYFNGLGDNDYAEASTNPQITERITRGEIFVLGRSYLSGEIQIELHPLFKITATVINNMADPSGIFQPRVLWDIAQDIQLVFGANINYGGRGTEYGGFEIAQSDLLSKPSNSLFIWISYFY